MRLLMEFGMGTVRCWLAEDAASGRRLELTEVESVRFADSGRVRTVEELARGLARRRELGWPESLTVYFAGGRFEATREQWKVLGGDVIEGIAMGKTLELGVGVLG